MVTMDLHANLTKRKIQYSTTISGFQTCPHVDLKQTGIRAARMLVSTLEGKMIPKIGWVKVPMVTPASKQVDMFPGAYLDIMTSNKNLKNLGAIDSSAFTVQPWMDIPELGWASLVITNDDVDLAKKLAMKLAGDMWGKRHELSEIDLIDPFKAISESLELEEGPILLTDLADGTLAGSPGDSVVVLKELLALDPQKRCLVSVCDPQVASVASRLGVGSEIDVDIGAKLSFAFSNSIQIQAEILWVGPASFQFAQQAYKGMLVQMGLCAVLAIGEIRLLVTSHPSFTTDPKFYESVGLNPRTAHIVVVKSHAGFHDGYKGISKKTIFLDTPGMSSDRIDSLEFINVDRPLFPWDSDMIFESVTGAFISRGV
jgi:microcystin degradation protein MlrC